MEMKTGVPLGISIPFMWSTAVASRGMKLTTHQISGLRSMYQEAGTVKFLCKHCSGIDRSLAVRGWDFGDVEPQTVNGFVLQDAVREHVNPIEAGISTPSLEVYRDGR
jgi:propanediol dehydratase large subunit